MDVASWLQDLGLERYETSFRETDVRAEDLCHLTAEDLDEAEGRPALGIHVLVGDRLRHQRENSHRALLEGRARMVAIVARKPD